MQAHPVFADILLHTDIELAQILVSDILERRTIHAWPLSCVQEPRLANGKAWAYKSQLPPTVEGEFYMRASSPLLTGHCILGTIGRCHTMALEWIEAPLLREVVLGPGDLAFHGERLLSQIGELGGDLPAYLDIGSPAAWLEFAGTNLERLKRLITEKRFRSIALASVELVGAWAQSAKLLNLLKVSDSRLIHGDLKADQIFILPDGYRVIDWQRPIIAPARIDLVSLMIGEGMDPTPWVDPDTIKLFWFLHLAWAVKAQFHLFPDFSGPLFNKWAVTAIKQITR